MSKDIVLRWVVCIEEEEERERLEPLPWG